MTFHGQDPRRLREMDDMLETIEGFLQRHRQGEGERVMGEIAEMMLNGDMCEACGVWLDGEGSGYPRYCSPECAAGRGAYFEPDQHASPRPKKSRRKHACPDCLKRFRSMHAMKQHWHDMHSAERPVAADAGQRKEGE